MNKLLLILLVLISVCFIACGSDDNKKNTDSDNDGIFDGIDLCPDTEVDTQVNEIGCVENPYNGDYIIYDEQGVNDFKQYTSIKGNLTIQCEHLISLDGLEKLTKIEGDLLIGLIDNSVCTTPECMQSWAMLYCPTEFEDIDGLRNLSLIAGDLNIGYNIYLENLNGLESLKTIGGDLNIYSNDLLVDLDGLHNLCSFNGNLNVHNNKNLCSDLVESLIQQLLSCNEDYNEDFISISNNKSCK